jgi:hypothetical protein
MQSFGDIYFDVHLDQQRAAEVSSSNEIVKMNWEVLSWLVNSICFLSK